MVASEAVYLSQGEASVLQAFLGVWIVSVEKG